MHITKRLSSILLSLPSSFTEDYPKRVPKYVIKDWEKFGNNFKTHITQIKDEYNRMEQENKLLKEMIENECPGEEIFI